jgi:hypothetical protein
LIFGGLGGSNYLRWTEARNEALIVPDALAACPAARRRRRVPQDEQAFQPLLRIQVVLLGTDKALGLLQSLFHGRSVWSQTRSAISSK